VDELIKKVSEKAGINTDQAKNAVNAVFEFIKSKVPGIGEKLQGMVSGGEGGGSGGVGDVLDDVRKKFGI
jgi:hypothetical protein